MWRMERRRAIGSNCVSGRRPLEGVYPLTMRSGDIFRMPPVRGNDGIDGGYTFRLSGSGV